MLRTLESVVAHTVNILVSMDAEVGTNILVSMDAEVGIKICVTIDAEMCTHIYVSIDTEIDSTLSKMLHHLILLSLFCDD